MEEMKEHNDQLNAVALSFGVSTDEIESAFRVLTKAMEDFIEATKEVACIVIDTVRTFIRQVFSALHLEDEKCRQALILYKRYDKQKYIDFYLRRVRKLQSKDSIPL